MTLYLNLSKTVGLCLLPLHNSCYFLLSKLERSETITILMSICISLMTYFRLFISSHLLVSLWYFPSLIESFSARFMILTHFNIPYSIRSIIPSIALHTVKNGNGGWWRGGVVKYLGYRWMPLKMYSYLNIIFIREKNHEHWHLLKEWGKQGCSPWLPVGEYEIQEEITSEGINTNSWNLEVWEKEFSLLGAKASECLVF